MFFKRSSGPIDISKFYLSGHTQFTLIRELLIDGYMPSLADKIHSNINKEACKSSWLNVTSKSTHPNYRLARLSINGAARDYHGNAKGSDVIFVEVDWKVFDFIFNNKTIPEVLHETAHSPCPLLILSIPLDEFREKKIVATNAYIHRLLCHLPQGKRLRSFRLQNEQAIAKDYARLVKHCPYALFGAKAFKASRRSSI